jgi:hypothetical protein
MLLIQREASSDNIIAGNIKYVAWTPFCRNQATPSLPITVLCSDKVYVPGCCGESPNAFGVVDVAEVR